MKYWHFVKIIRSAQNTILFENIFFKSSGAIQFTFYVGRTSKSVGTYTCYFVLLLNTAIVFVTTFKINFHINILY